MTEQLASIGGGEIAVTLLAILTSILVIIYRRAILKDNDTPTTVPSDRFHTDLSPFITRIDHCETEVKAVVADALLKLEKHDIHITQLIESSYRTQLQFLESCHKGQMQLLREMELESRRQSERLSDKIDQVERRVTERRQ